METLTLPDGRALEYLVEGPATAIPLVLHHGTPSGTVRYADGREEPLDADALTRAPEAALKALAAASVCLAVALLVLHRT